MYYEYIIEDGVYYVPRPSGVIAGMVRHSAFRSLLGQSPTIASPEFWEKLVGRSNVKILDTKSEER
jgi:hypothetical protein